MKSLRITVISGLIVALLALSCGGCASSFSTVKSSDSGLQTRVYGAPYEKALDAAVEAASKTRNCKVQDVDESRGVVTAVDSDRWRSYIIKVIVTRGENNTVRVDVTSRTSADIVPTNREFIAEYFQRLDQLIKDQK